MHRWHVIHAPGERRRIQDGDLPIVLGFVFVAAVAVALVQLVLDITYTIIDPRTRVS